MVTIYEIKKKFNPYPLSMPSRFVVVFFSIVIKFFIFYNFEKWKFH